jgi:hypothetical protein
MIQEDMIGRLCLVEFLDHVSGGREPMHCSALGWVESVTPEAAVLTWWRVSDETYRADNDEPFTLLQSAITRAFELQRVRQLQL